MSGWHRPPLAPSLTTAPVGDLITLGEAKQHLRVDHNDEDDLIGALVIAAVAHVDGWGGILGRALLSQTWTAYFPDLASDHLRLPLRPVISLSSLKYYDAAGTLQTWTASNYRLLTDDLSPFVTVAPNVVWPTSLFGRDDAVAVAFVAGYATAAAVPGPIKQAILLMVGDMYEHRETVVIGAAATEIPMSMTVDRLLRPYRAGSF